VATAKDGVEALEFLQDELPAVILLDIEMPRMDGYEVTRAIRANSRLKGIPIIMITSRTADKHRQYALDLGVSQYMGKPFDEDALLEAIAHLTAHAVPA
jgi:chemosensory pili system protein ChpA (sensor histidine kinase/response regulator)